MDVRSDPGNRMGTAKQIPKGRWLRFSYRDTDAQPFMLFVFLYRTHRKSSEEVL